MDAPDSYRSRSRLSGISGSWSSLRLFRFEGSCANPCRLSPAIDNHATTTGIWSGTQGLSRQVQFAEQPGTSQIDDRLVGVACHAATGVAQKYLPDDPISKVPEVGSAQNAKAQSINALYDFLHHSTKYKTPPATPSLAINTLGEVPDSSWFTNRPPLSIEELRNGARIHGGPQPPFTVVAAKTEGVTPGFRLEDGRGLTYFVKVDPRQNVEMGSAADVMGALFLYAAGYNVPENYIVLARREDLRLSEKATITGLSGKKYPLTKAQFEKILDQVPVESSGQVRLMASLTVSGRIIGPFRYEYTRSDDPNDLIPHDRRRDLRGLDVLFAWLNHTDAKGENSLDSVVGKGPDART